MKHEHILGIKADSVKSQLASFVNKLAPIDALTIDPTQVVVGHREYLDKHNGHGDPSVLQAIGYAVIHHPTLGYLAYQRKGSEGRLDGKISIGFGGHTSISDIVAVKDHPEEISLKESVGKGLLRELEEEIIIKNGYLGMPKFLGLIICDRAPVDLLHIGFAYQFEMVRGDFEVDLGDHGKEMFWVKSLKDVDVEHCEEWTKIIALTI